MIGLTQQEQVEFERIKDEMWNNGYETAKEEFGWHTASELPVIPEGKNWVKVVALVDFGDNTLRPRNEIYKDKGWSKKDMWTVKFWCYPPENE